MTTAELPAVSKKLELSTNFREVSQCLDMAPLVGALKKRNRSRDLVRAVRNSRRLVDSSGEQCADLGALQPRNVLALLVVHQEGDLLVHVLALLHRHHLAHRVLVLRLVTIIVWTLWPFGLQIYSSIEH